MSFLLLESGGKILLENGIDHLLLEGLGIPPLLINRRLSAVSLSPLANADPWSIDPQRTIQLAPGAQSTPWSIDPQRTIEIP